jgi:hypothetical protein
MRAGNFSRLSAFAVVLLAGDALACAEGPPKPPQAPTATVTLALSQEAYQGLPCIATVTVTNVARKRGEEQKPAAEADVQALLAALQARVSFPAFDLLSAWPPVGVAVRDGREKTVKAAVAPSPYAFWLRHPAVFEHPKPRPTVTLAPGERGCFLVDLAPWLAGLAPGEYTVVLFLHNSEHGSVWRSRGVRLRLAAVTEAERRAVEDAFPATRRPAEYSPRSWLNRDMVVTPLKARLRESEFAAVVPYAFLSAAARGTHIAQAPVELLTHFPKHLQPLADCLRYEFLFASGQTQEARKVREHILRTSPAWRWRIRTIEDGSGLLRSAVQAAAP